MGTIGPRSRGEVLPSLKSTIAPEYGEDIQIGSITRVDTYGANSRLPNERWGGD